MTKKLLLLVISTFIYTYAFSQDLTSSPSDCIQDFTFNSKTVSGDNPRVNDIIISWDFSQTTNSENLELTLQVQPLNSCWMGVEGTLRSEIKTIKIANFSDNLIGNQELLYNDLNCKCLKWKAIIIDTNTNCQVKTEWQFISFL
ncbi:hypothetical protein [Psychroserpens algicola]|uniref:Uncharacterized protein n=1 Tax=Psychroserpens algicola TaxID=1719034 RepID=A0ABT0H8W6_9FLAO|nr:hypothetical protein [Psychroserpens algicola]MCK8480803.1 hypothetical protein [Psychroserpens algicola]